MCAWLVVSDANFDLLVNVVSARFFHLKVTVFPLVASNLWGDRYFETDCILCLMKP